MDILVCVNMQNDYTTGVLSNISAVQRTKAMAHRIHQAHKEGEKVIFLLDEFATPNDYDFHIETDVHPRHCIAESWGAMMVDEIKKEYDKENDIIFSKDTYGSMDFGYYLTTLDNKLRDENDYIHSIEFIGTVTEEGILANAVIARAALTHADIIINPNLVAGHNNEGAAFDTMNRQLIIVAR